MNFVSGYDELEQMVNLVAIDSKFDFGKENRKRFSGFLSLKLRTLRPNNLFN
jgi:hypothetical protein